VSEWRAETSADLADAARRIESTLESLAGEPTAEQLRSVWMAYLLVEKSVAFIKFDLDEENPGRFIKLRAYSVPDERQALQFALRNLRKGAADFAVGDFVQALKNLRESRNYLRALLREKRLARARKARPS
jgi:ABC-type amino acid transport substrate-binding protein